MVVVPPLSTEVRSWALGLRSRSDTDLLALSAELALERRELDARLASVSAELARRSAPDAGHAGVAQQTGDRTAQRLVERIGGVTTDEARRLIAVGARIANTEDPVGGAVAASQLSIASAGAIVEELDRCVGTVPDAALRRATETLVAAASGIRVGELRREARDLRDQLDEDGIPEREERLHAQRRLALTPLPTGMTRIEGLLDPESAALVTDAFDQALSPRRGGPRFVDPLALARGQRIADDPRTTDQLMLDTLVDIVRVAAGADPGELFGPTTPAVRVHIAAADLKRGAGPAVLEGQSATISVTSAARISCSSGSIPIVFDESGAQVLDLGREQRLYSRRQRIALAARDGGCLAPGCDRPPAACEAHHIDEWSAHGGRTDVARGVLLCRFHHRWLHVHGHRIVSSHTSSLTGFALQLRTTGQLVPWPSKRRVVVTPQGTTRGARVPGNPAG